MADYPRHPSGRILFPWEIPSRPGGGVSPLAGEPGPNPVVNTPSWMRAGLALKGDEVPTLLWLPKIQPVIEAYQDGWGIARYLDLQATQGASVVAAGVTLIDPDSDPDLAVVSRILSVDVLHTAGAAAGRVSFSLTHLIGGNPLAISTTRAVVDIAPSTFVGMDDIFSAGHPVIIPPNYRLRVNFPTTGVGESFVTNLLVAQAPAGFPLGL